VSTVDSGNLCAHLFTVQSGLRQLPDESIVGPQFFDGLNDTLAILEDIDKADDRVTVAEIRQLLDQALHDRPRTLCALSSALTKLVNAANALPAKPDDKSMSNAWSRRL